MRKSFLRLSRDAFFACLIAVTGCRSTTPEKSDQATPVVHSIGLGSVYAGFPVAVSTDASYKLLSNTGYVVGYSEQRADPVWAAYHLSTDGPLYHDPRPNMKFATDNRTTAKIKHNDYTNVSYAYDRGHMAPNHAIDKFYGPAAQRETFKMSNVCPQTACLNEETWAALEAEIADKFTTNYQEVWAIAGPIFGLNPATVPSVAVQIPDAFFYVIVREENSKPKMLGVILDQNVSGDHILGEFVHPIKQIEERTGLDFFPNLSATYKTAAYMDSTTNAWPLNDDLKSVFRCRLAH